MHGKSGHESGSAENLPFGEYFISVITEMELLSFSGLDRSQQDWLNRFLADLEIIGIDNDVKQVEIALRRQHRLRLPDAIIAASTITRDAVLFTKDKGLTGIPNLHVRNLVLRVEKADPLGCTPADEAP